MTTDSSAAASARARLEEVFLSALPDIERAIRLISSRNGLSSTEAEDFSSEAKLALVENDYDVLARFEGRSSLTTYLVTVLQRRFLDYRRRLWGKWRHSAKAQRLGSLAMRLEALLYREGLAMEQACAALASAPGIEATYESLVTLAQQLPVRPLRHAQALEEVAAHSEPADPSVVPPEQLLQLRTTARRCQAAIGRCLEKLSAQDRVVVRLRFEDGTSVADIARLLRLDQKLLYRRIETMLRGLKEDLASQDVGWPEVEEMIDSGQCHLRLSLPTTPAPKTTEARPSISEAAP